MGASPWDVVGITGGHLQAAPLAFAIPVDTGQIYVGQHPQLSAGAYVNDRKVIGVGINDQALIKPTGDPLMSTITRQHDARGGTYQPQGFGPAYSGTATVKSDGNWYSKTINPVTGAGVIAQQELIISDLAGNGGPLMGEIALQPLLDLVALNQTGPSNF